MCELRVVVLANLHPRMERNILVSWLKHESDSVRKGEPLYLVETRKGVFEVCSEFGGSVELWLVPEGSSVAVGQDLVLIRMTAGEGDSPGVTARGGSLISRRSAGGQRALGTGMNRPLPIQPAKAEPAAPATRCTCPALRPVLLTHDGY